MYNHIWLVFSLLLSIAPALCAFKKTTSTALSTLQTTFSDIYRHNGWRDSQSVSGSGSNRVQTRVLRKLLPSVLKGLNVKTLLDAPCGDFYWMSDVDLSSVNYIGVDIVPELIEQNRIRYANKQRRFIKKDITCDILPQADLILCRDCLVHLSFKDCLAALKNFKKTGAQYILMTTFVERKTNADTKSPYWRPLNLTRPPFNFTPPILLINEECTEKRGAYTDKSLGLWKLADLKIAA